MPTPEQARIEQLENEVKNLNIRLETLINYLQVETLGPPDGRARYDSKVRSALKQANLQ
jgi:hypothetical protein